MLAQMSWQGDLLFSGTTENGQKMMLDGHKQQAPSPMEAILMAAGSCSSIDVVNILQKSKQEITDVTVKLSAERAEGVPAVFTDIHLHFVVTGHNIKARQVERAVDLSAEKYCSVAIMLSKSVKITHSYEIKQAD